MGSPTPHPPLCADSPSPTPASLTVRSLDLSSAALFSSWISVTPAMLLNLEGRIKIDMKNMTTRHQVCLGLDPGWDENS